MNYDPIHDRFLGSLPGAVAAESAPGQPVIQSQEQNTQTPSGVSMKSEHDEIDEVPSSPRVPESHTTRLAPGELPANFRHVLAGVKHLKKADGEPFWRKDIQADFLDALFSDQNAVFTNVYTDHGLENVPNPPKLTFAQLYIRTLASSLKLSKVLRERLLEDFEMAVAVSKVCILVNAGRMNTTVNFVPDMKSALRTYHSIPCLQLVTDGPPLQLQDTPRLKTILKAVSDSHDHLETILDVLAHPQAQKPNTNVIKLIFLMSSFFQNIPFHHETAASAEPENSAAPERLRNLRSASGPQNRFMEFFVADDLEPRSRATRFLWLMYTYLETSFTPEEIALNPFGANAIPEQVVLLEADQYKYDVDTEREVEFAAQMYHTRMSHIYEDASVKKLGVKTRREKLTRFKRPLDEELPSQDDTAVMEDLPDDPIVDDDEDKPAVSKNPDRVKRKKPTPLVGLLVDDSKKPPLDDRVRWENPEFPINVDRLQEKFTPCTAGVFVRTLSRDSALSVAQKKAIVSKCKPLINHVSKVVPDFRARRAKTAKWVQKYFDDTRKAGGLFRMEWEDVRHDLVLGIESYTYQQLGKSLIVRNQDIQMADEKREHGDPTLLRTEDFLTGINELPGDSAPVDVSSIEKFGAGYLPLHDYDRANERTTYEHDLMRVVELAVVQNPQLRRSRPKMIRFDFENGGVLFS